MANIKEFLKNAFDWLMNSAVGHVIFIVTFGVAFATVLRFGIEYYHSTQCDDKWRQTIYESKYLDGECFVEVEPNIWLDQNRILLKTQLHYMIEKDKIYPATK